ncbi:small proline-rich protein 2F, isoform CRA_b [Mus musculus]|nr:small proline-rich protein 2F, isoform CRA_b [Mus musculus]
MSYQEQQASEVFSSLQDRGKRKESISCHSIATPYLPSKV